MTIRTWWLLRMMCMERLSLISVHWWQNCHTIRFAFIRSPNISELRDGEPQWLLYTKTTSTTKWLPACRRSRNQYWTNVIPVLACNRKKWNLSTAWWLTAGRLRWIIPQGFLCLNKCRWVCLPSSRFWIKKTVIKPRCRKLFIDACMRCGITRGSHW